MAGRNGREPGVADRRGGNALSHAIISVPLMILIGGLFAWAVGPLGWVGGAITIIAHWYGRERRDAERHHDINPYEWRNPQWWRLLWPGCWYADARDDFLFPAIAVSVLAGMACIIHFTL